MPHPLSLVTPPSSPEDPPSIGLPDEDPDDPPDDAPDDDPDVEPEEPPEDDPEDPEEDPEEVEPLDPPDPEPDDEAPEPLPLDPEPFWSDVPQPAAHKLSNAPAVAARSASRWLLIDLGYLGHAVHGSGRHEVQVAYQARGCAPHATGRNPGVGNPQASTGSQFFTLHPGRFPVRRASIHAEVEKRNHETLAS
jgi:hypothetical protein